MTAPEQGYLCRRLVTTYGRFVNTCRLVTDAEARPSASCWSSTESPALECLEDPDEGAALYQCASLGEIIRCQCVITLIIGSLSSAGVFTRTRCPSGGGLCEKILLSTRWLRAQRQMADFGCGWSATDVGPQRS
jgi:hypothetical protein